ncbi:MAG: lipoyl(octanoyl) transferase LipB [Gemmatimonadota bacterium]|nr:lipoyl(octanoyl) transferase LipB [Gemmatimonadota bacterium]
MSTDLAVVTLGRAAYAETLHLQRDLARRRISGDLSRDLLLLVEHPPVVTLGRSTQPQHLATPREFLAARGIEVHEIERGGDVTFHGPGQLVGYPIYRLSEHREDLHWFLRQLEQALIETLAPFGIAGERRAGFTGVWTGGRKIASIGIHVRQWVTWHGFALNVTTDLSYFDLIVPCGIPDVVMTSMQRELDARAPRDLWTRAMEGVMLGFAEVFGQRPQLLALEELAGGSGDAGGGGDG